MLRELSFLKTMVLHQMISLVSNESIELQSHCYTIVMPHLYFLLTNQLFLQKLPIKQPIGSSASKRKTVNHQWRSQCLLCIFLWCSKEGRQQLATDCSRRSKYFCLRRNGKKSLRWVVVSHLYACGHMYSPKTLRYQSTCHTRERKINQFADLE